MVSRSKNAAGKFLTLEDQDLVAQCEVDHYRARGPGGQKKNKTRSAVRLRHRPTGVIVTANEERSQHINLTRAIRRLRQAIALNVRTEVDLERYSQSELLSSCLLPDGQLSVGLTD